jgi:hypothetical protein
VVLERRNGDIMGNKKYLILAVLAIFALTSVLFVAMPTESSLLGGGIYDPWADVNDDGKIDGKDIAFVSKGYDSTGTPITKAALLYDSGWLDITEKAGQCFSITHGLNSTDIIVDITGKTTINGGVHQRHLGGIEYIPGWSKTYGGADHDVAYSVVQTSDGGYAIVGRTGSFGAGYHDFWLVKADAGGNMQWNKTYEGALDDVAYSVVQTSDGGYAIAGRTGIGAGNGDFWLIKTDENGTVQWNKTYGGTESDVASSVQQTIDEGYIVAGWTYSLGAGNSDFWLIKTDSFGNLLWSKTYGGTSRDEAWSVIETNDEGYALAGFTQSFGAGMSDFWIVKTDADGNIGFKFGLAWTDSTPNTITLYRGATDPYWNYVRVRIWKIKT